MTRSITGVSNIGSRLGLANRVAPLWFLALVVVVVLAALAFVYGHPESHSAVFVDDSFVFFDGIHRIKSGQVPHVDFSTPVGALAYWLPYVGSTVVGGYAGAVEVASLLIAALAVPAGAILLWQRAAPVMAALVLVTIGGIMVVPLTPGWDPQEVSHAMHYNRWSWGLILALFLLGLPPPADARGGFVRGTISGALVATLFFIKITYFAVGSVFLLLLLACPDERRRDAFVAMIVAAVLLVAALAGTGGMIVSYLGDIAQALEADKAVRGSYLDIAMINRHSLIVFLIALYAGLLKANLKWQDVLLAIYIMVSGLAIVDQNFQFTFIVSLPAAFAILAVPRRTGTETARLADSIIIVSAIAMVLPFAADWARVTLRYMRPAPAGNHATLDIPGFQNFYVYDRKSPLESDVPKFSRPVDAAAYLRGETEIGWLNQRDYLPALEDGVRLLSRAGVKDATIYTLGYTNVMALLTDAPREPFGYSWYHMNRNVSPKTLPDATVMFGGIDYVMAPLATHTPVVNEIIDVYGGYLSRHLVEVAQSDHWILFRHDRDR